jgi:hypothetical protein
MSDEASTRACDNEIRKYNKASFDRLSTGTVIVGFVGPAALVFHIIGKIILARGFK